MSPAPTHSTPQEGPDCLAHTAPSKVTHSPHIPKSMEPCLSYIEGLHVIEIPCLENAERGSKACHDCGPQSLRPCPLGPAPLASAHLDSAPKPLPHPAPLQEHLVRASCEAGRAGSRVYGAKAEQRAGNGDGGLGVCGSLPGSPQPAGWPPACLGLYPCAVQGSGASPPPYPPPPASPAHLAPSVPGLWASAHLASALGQAWPQGADLRSPFSL